MDANAAYTNGCDGCVMMLAMRSRQEIRIAMTGCSRNRVDTGQDHVGTGITRHQEITTRLVIKAHQESIASG